MLLKTVTLLVAMSISLHSMGQDSLQLNTRSRKERKKNDAFIRKNLPGKWKDQNSTLYFYPNGNLLIRWDADSLTFSGVWEIDKGRLMTYEIPSLYSVEYEIFYFSPVRMKFQGRNYDKNLWIADKIGRFDSKENY